jgi:hypothetical protein
MSNRLMTGVRSMRHHPLQLLGKRVMLRPLREGSSTSGMRSELAAPAGRYPGNLDQKGPLLPQKTG